MSWRLYIYTHTSRVVVYIYKHTHRRQSAYGVVLYVYTHTSRVGYIYKQKAACVSGRLYIYTFKSSDGIYTSTQVAECGCAYIYAEGCCIYVSAHKGGSAAVCVVVLYIYTFKSSVVYIYKHTHRWQCCEDRATKVVPECLILRYAQERQ